MWLLLWNIFSIYSKEELITLFWNLSFVCYIFLIMLNIEWHISDVEKRVYVKQLLLSTGIVVGCLLLTLVVNAGIAITLSALGSAMSWFSCPIWIFFLYICPTLFVPMTVLLLASKWQRPVSTSIVIKLQTRQVLSKTIFLKDIQLNLHFMWKEKVMLFSCSSN